MDEQRGHTVSESPGTATGREGVGLIDSTVPHAARVYDYMLGGSTNFEVDRAAAEQAAALVGGMDRIRSEVRANRAFLGRAVRWLIHEAGIRQFLDIGTGIPNDDNVHAVALNEAPDARIVYVDHDPIVLAHAHILLKDAPAGSTTYLQADFRNPEDIVERAGAHLDLTRPVAVMLVGLLHHFRDADEPGALVARLLRRVPSGSYLVVSHLAGDLHAEGYVEAGEALDEAMEEPLVLRSREQVAAFLAGCELVEPGLVQVDEWHPPEDPAPGLEGWTNPLYAGIGRVP
jgi:SAM-dependent methyltransferase